MDNYPLFKPFEKLRRVAERKDCVRFRYVSRCRSLLIHSTEFHASPMSNCTTKGYQVQRLSLLLQADLSFLPFQSHCTCFLALDKQINRGRWPFSVSLLFTIFLVEIAAGWMRSRAAGGASVITYKLLIGNGNLEQKGWIYYKVEIVGRSLRSIHFKSGTVSRFRLKAHKKRPPSWRAVSPMPPPIFSSKYSFQTSMQLHIQIVVSEQEAIQLRPNRSLGLLIISCPFCKGVFSIEK